MEDKINEIVDVVNSQGLETIKDTVNDVKARVGVLENENDTQDSEISQLGTRISAVESKNATQDSQISEVTGRVATAESNIKTLQSDKADKSELATIESRTDAIEDDVTSIQEAITVIDGDITNLENNKADKTALNALETDVVDLSTKVDGIESDVSELATTIDGKADSADVTALGNRVTAVEQKNTSQDTEINALNTAIDGKADSADVTALGNRVTEIESEIGDIPKIDNSGPFLTDLSTSPVTNGVQIKSDGYTLNNQRTQFIATIQPADVDKYGVIKYNDIVLKNQGSENTGKALVVGSDGMVAPGDVGGGGSSAIATFQFNGTRSEEDFNKFRDWINAVGTYKQISGDINSSNGAVSIRVSMGSSGKTNSLFCGGGSFFTNSPAVFYPMSDCTFRVTDEDTITITAYYINYEGTRIGHSFSFSPTTYIDGSAFVIN